MPLNELRFLCMMVFLISSPARSFAASAPSSAYPFHDPYVAAATISILGDNGARDSRILRIRGLPGRDNLPSLEGRGHVSLALYRQNNPAPLLFVLPGLGASPYFGMAPYLANIFYRRGYHVVVLPSPMSWNFALSASRSGAPGYSPADARDLYEVMQNALRILRTEQGMKISKIDFLGFSLGALEGAHVSVIDAAQGRIGIDKYLLINPPIDLGYASSKIDEWNQIEGNLGRARAHDIITRAVAVVGSFNEAPLDDLATFELLAQGFRSFTTRELQFLVAENLQSQLAELVYVTQVVLELEVLGAPRDEMRRRIEEARLFTLADYNRKIGLPLWRKQIGDPDADLSDLLQLSSLASLYDRLRQNHKVRILHNRDDFLAQESSIEQLKLTLGDRVTLYPHGGHLGNIWFPPYKADMLRYFNVKANTARVWRR